MTPALPALSVGLTITGYFNFVSSPFISSISLTRKLFGTIRPAFLKDFLISYLLVDLYKVSKEFPTKFIFSETNTTAFVVMSDAMEVIPSIFKFSHFSKIFLFVIDSLSFIYGTI